MTSDEYTATTYGDAWAEIYDDPVLAWPAPAAAVEFLRQRAADGPALELGVGTGRVAIPLAERGVPVVGVEVSAAMVKQARAKPCAGELEIVEADFATLALDRCFPLVYCVGQSFFQLLTQAGQAGCLAGVARHLAPGGRFVVECLVPDIGRFRAGQDTLTTRVLTDRVLLTTSMHDPLEQVIRSSMLDITDEGTRLYPSHLRYAWPAELVLLAERAGLVLLNRWGSYSGGPFTARPGPYVCEFGAAS